MEKNEKNIAVNTSRPRIAVVGIGYWGKNLVRNFHELGALAALCDPGNLSKRAMPARLSGRRFVREFGEFSPIRPSTPCASRRQP